ncbi:VLRF1 family aeRF1-type release factor [Evansella sp. AB-P1]|uniref:VLRF1 family aeRF1-type release factor n=1 Tax=Evansella sp. AB-P1 TaxID=3037653 RepID=UPI00241F7FEE|nr:VLRF1 family aeRF1-type release factor [Evansella sp. AB-P1]MDG5786118.1 VLRF1 family aeRF1-type release factor [Evansella sp. AB-P1]
MALTKDLEALKKFQCDDGKCVLSLYLNTDRSERNQQQGEWKIRLKNGLKRLEEYLIASGNEEQLKSYRMVRKKVEKEIRGNQSKLMKSVVIFASEEQDLWSVHYLNLPVESSFHWEKKPVLDQLIELQEQFPKSAIIMPNADEVKIMDVDFGEIKDTRVYYFDIKTEDWKFKDGLASTERTASSANHVDDYQQRFEENRNRFYKKIATNIERMKKDRNWEAVYIVGEPDVVHSFQSQLRVKINKLVKKNLNNLDASKVLSQVLD